LSEWTVINQRDIFNVQEQIHLRKLLHYLDVDGVFDVGAHEGEYATKLRKKCSFDGLIFSYEPVPELAEFLRQCSAKDAKWSVVESAVGVSGGSAKMHVMERDTFSSLSTPVHDKTQRFKNKNVIDRTVYVDCRTLDQIFREVTGRHKLSKPFLKLDTQGYDHAILEASRHALSKFVGIQVETSVKGIYADSVCFLETIRYMKECGFELSALIPNTHYHFPEIIELDCIFVRRDMT
jgi:FkbM family methyltransferase